MRTKVRPHRTAEPRTLGRFRREVISLLTGSGMAAPKAIRLVDDYKEYVRLRWKAGRPPCAVSDHLRRWSKEKAVCPCKRGGDPEARCEVHGRRRVKRDAENPKVGEIYESKKSGRRWEVVSVDGDRVVMKPTGMRSEGSLLWSKKSLKGMKELSTSLFASLFGSSDDNPVGAEARIRSGSDMAGRRRRKRPGRDYSHGGSGEYEVWQGREFWGRYGSRQRALRTAPIYSEGSTSSKVDVIYKGKIIASFLNGKKVSSSPKKATLVQRGRIQAQRAKTRGRR